MASGLEQSIKKKNFENFDLVEDYSDHHYAKNKSQNCFTDTGSCVYNKIMREWKILSNALPDSIFVNWTPYHDALFFFDIAIPSDYPENPPQVFYMSHGPRLNPYLFPGGQVCLNLLGKGNEIWNPTASTILQDRAFTILRASKAYRDSRVRIGLFSYYGPSSSSKNNEIKVSRTFRDSMNKLIPQLSLEFSRNGTSLQNGLKKPENVERKKTIEPKIGLKTKNVTLFHKVLGKLGLCLGLKNDSQILNERNGTLIPECDYNGPFVQNLSLLKTVT
ncbi:hypothetical protein QYF36_018095 [Acer negundo]|nr:hypothetical protein QYF36_018095 [Acer negundo]